ncbi:PP2C family protein-serine/threonine phosphatase [Saccharicrinis sp. FJH2]|uniref:PP2C family protein-serine/threonine phosphatase n=1 Tax=unclassified Saccharicrinis TaxID=2646859 RepID=UPI0035D447CD
MYNIEFSPYTFHGRREYNQDYLAAEQLNENTWIFAVADGMGGANGGELASYVAINALINHFEDSSIVLNETNLKENLGMAVEKAHGAINDEISRDRNLNGMGTTLVCILIHDNKYVWASIGDSRIYYFNSNEYKQLTTDHSYVQDFMKAKGEKLPKDILDNYSHILTKCIDGGMEKADLFPTDSNCLQLNEGESFLLCSDGLLTDRINTNINLFKNFIMGRKDLDEAAKSLVAYAYEMGSDDNISVVLVRVGVKHIKELKLREFSLPVEDSADNKNNLLKRIFNKKYS